MRGGADSAPRGMNRVKGEVNTKNFRNSNKPFNGASSSSFSWLAEVNS